MTVVGQRAGREPVQAYLVGRAVPQAFRSLEHHGDRRSRSTPGPPLVMDGGTVFTFVTDGVGSALPQARVAAGDRDVAVAGIAG